MRASVVAIALAPLLACQGYWDAPLQVREELSINVEAFNLHPGAIGTLQLSLNAPEDVEGPLFVVGSPDILAEDPAVTPVAWGYGACSAHDGPGSAPDSQGQEDKASLRVCMAVYTPAAATWSPLYVGLVVDSRRKRRRFSATAEVPPP